ncbi:DNA repair protein RadC [Fontibacillus solani]|uniref:DNA repair protein RadC n=1 Tax=Fontibacillus solani TaxID=1572857 RepID=A0A7W3XRY8_9BACL|nr:DNA repair protein RadC [Fontibacillus solani]MBA9085971.1 DNA repair protein RadC [Fontibacillus solani]
MNPINELSTIKSLLGEALAEKPGSYIVDELFDRFPTVQELMNVTEFELLSIKGVGKVRAKQVIATMQLARRLGRPAVNTPQIIRRPQDTVDLLMPEMRYLQQENFVCMFLNTKNHLIGRPETLSIGSLNCAIVTPHMVFRAAVKRSAASVICVHNHPSGDPTPSSEDIQLTKRLVESGTIVGVDVLDHLVLGDGTFKSLKEQGLM